MYIRLTLQNIVAGGLLPVDSLTLFNNLNAPQASGPSRPDQLSRYTSHDVTGGSIFKVPFGSDSLADRAYPIFLFFTSTHRTTTSGIFLLQCKKAFNNKTTSNSFL